MILTVEEARSIINDDCEGWEKVESKITGHIRWSICYEEIYKFEGRFYKFCFRRGATEQQDERPYEFDKTVQVSEVFEKEVLTKVYV